MKNEVESRKLDIYQRSIGLSVQAPAQASLPSPRMSMELGVGLAKSIPQSETPPTLVSGGRFWVRA